MQGSAYLVKGYVGGDFLVAEDAIPMITREFATLANATGAAIVYLAGSPLIATNQGATNATVVQALAGQENSVSGLLMEKTTVLANSTLTPVAYVARTPVAIDFNMIPTVDQTGASYASATLKTRLGNIGIIVRSEGVTQQTQTT